MLSWILFLEVEGNSCTMAFDEHLTEHGHSFDGKEGTNDPICALIRLVPLRTLSFRC